MSYQEMLNEVRNDVVREENIVETIEREIFKYSCDCDKKKTERIELYRYHFSKLERLKDLKQSLENIINLKEGY